MTDESLNRLYADYRGDAYFQQRHHFEPWYTHAFNDGMGSDREMQQRRAVLAEALSECGIADTFASVLDHGGDRGQMLLDLGASRKAVYEISGATPEPGVVSIDQTEMAAGAWDLILCCHVLEHLPEPKTYLEALLALGHDGTVYVFEVPEESFRSFGFNASRLQKHWVTWIAGHPGLFKLFDFLSSALRLKLKVVPPFFFVALREHLNLYSIAGLTRLLTDNEFHVLSAKVRSTGHIVTVAINRNENGDNTAMQR